MPIPSGHFTISITGFDRIADRLDRYNTAVHHTSRVLTAGIASVLRKETNEAFSKERDPATGTPWPDWAPSYVSKLTGKGKGKNRKLHKKLQLSGLLRKNIQESYDGSSAGLGVNLRYSRIHQLGGMTGRGHAVKIPARPYLGIGDYAKNKIARLLKRWTTDCFLSSR